MAKRVGLAATAAMIVLAQNVIQPPSPSEMGRGPAPVYTAPAPVTSAPMPDNPGPVTGYGEGGMQRPPGEPIDPIYSAPPYTTNPMAR